MPNPNLYFGENFQLIEQGNAKLASVLAAKNGNIASSARGKFVIINYKLQYCFHSRMAIFHCDPLQHFQVVILPLKIRCLL